MSALKIFTDSDPSAPLVNTSDRDVIVRELSEAGIRFEQWQASRNLSPGAPQDEVIDAYRADIDRLMNEEGYQTVDVVSIDPDNPKKEEMRGKFLEEHRHGEDEVRFFVAGSGLFSLHIGDKVYEVLCERGDLISVPAGTPHWFDMGPNPSFIAVRLFNNPDGWVAKFTGSDIAGRFSRLDN